MAGWKVAVRTEFTANMRDDVRLAVEQRLGDMEQLESEDIAAAMLYGCRSHQGQTSTY